MRILNGTFQFIIGLIFLFGCSTQSSIQQKEIIEIKANEKLASLRAGENYWEKSWHISPEINPDTWYVLPKKNEAIKATFITDLDSISFYVKESEVVEFKVILQDTLTAMTNIKGVGPMANFNESYKTKNRGKTVIEIPDVYELINVVFAMTNLSAEDDSHVVKKDSPYHDEVITWFAPYKYHEAVTTIDSILRDHFNMYFGLKMDTYIYKFIENGIVSKGIYDRLAQPYGENMITPELLVMLDDFSKQSDFITFYKDHQAFYNDQIEYYKTEINIARMQEWLNENYPRTTYDCFKVIFSPLVDWNQSATWLDNNNFKEAQAHVNFPYPIASDTTRSTAENKLVDGNILFTEFNHAYHNPEAELYFNTPAFQEAFGDISFWVVEKSIAANSYNNSGVLFNELMNWSLVSLYQMDNATDEIDLQKLISSTEHWQTNRRGFKHFKSFNRHLIKLYKTRTQGQLASDLYTDMIVWCKTFRNTYEGKRNASSINQN